MLKYVLRSYNHERVSNNKINEEWLLYIYISHWNLFLNMINNI